MKRFKIFGLSVATAASMTMLAAPASADYVTTTTGGAPATPTIHAVSEGFHVLLHNPEANIECASTFGGTPYSHGAGIPIFGSFSSFSFTGCTNGWTVTVQSGGEFEINGWTGHNGRVTSTGMTITATLNLLFFHITCRYRTFATELGIITGGNPATFHLEASVPFHSGSSACGVANSNWTGDYQMTSALYVASS